MRVNAKKYDEALPLVDKLLLMDPNNVAIITMKGRILFNTGSQVEGRNLVTKALGINPKYYQAYSYRASMSSLMHNQDSIQVLTDYDMGIEFLEEESQEIMKMKATYLRSLGYRAHAINVLNDLLELNHSNYDALVIKGTILQELGKNDAAMTSYDLAISFFPKKQFAYQERGYFNLVLGNYERAILDFNKAEEFLKPSSEKDKLLGLIHNNRGFAYYNLDSLGAALNDYSKSEYFFPENSYLYKNKALTLLKLNNKEAACIELQKAITLGFTELYGNEVVNLQQENCTR